MKYTIFKGGSALKVEARAMGPNIGLVLTGKEQEILHLLSEAQCIEIIAELSGFLAERQEIREYQRQKEIRVEALGHKK